MELHLTLEPRAAAVPAARHRLVRWLEDVGERSLTGDAALVVSELVTNAVMHAGDTDPPALIRVKARRAPNRLRIEVVDPRADRVPVSRDTGAAGTDVAATDATEPGGRGLLLVTAVARSWGYGPCGDGKMVWAELTGAR